MVNCDKFSTNDYELLVENARLENLENKRKSFSNINKNINDIESFDNTSYLEMVSIFMNHFN